MPEKRTEEEIIKPMAVTVIGTGDGRLQDTVAQTPNHMPNLVVQVVTPVVAVLVRAANMFFVTLTGLAGTTATGFTALDFKQMIITALITAGLGSLKDIATIFAGLQRKFPLASGSICLLFALSVGCAATPPALTPESRVAWQATRVIKGLDLVRDTAIDAHRHGLMATETTRKVVLWHQGSLRVIQAAGTTLSWRPAVQVSLQELQAALPPEDRARLSVYFTLIHSLLNEQVTRRMFGIIPLNIQTLTVEDHFIPLSGGNIAGAR